MVISATSGAGKSLTFPRVRATSATNAGSFLFPRFGGGARKGESVSMSNRSDGTSRATSLKFWALGNVTLNGALVPVDNLAAALNALAPRPSEVCYFREKPKGEAPAAVRVAINAIISTRLPISFYSDATFSTRVSMPTQH